MSSSVPDDVGAFIQRAMRRHEAERTTRDASPGHDFLLGHVAVEWKLVSPETLVDCLREQQENRGNDLGAVLLRRKIVDEAGLAKLTRECTARAQRSALSQRFELLERLGEGAMAVVYRAVDRSMGRDVALKMLRLPLESHEGARARFTREAHAAGSLAHPNVVRIFDAGQDEGRTYLVMELVVGRPLGIAMAENRPLRELVAMLEGAARGVQAAHDAGIVHRDLKPGNILVARDGQAKVADFGLAYVQNSALTQTGAPMGTPLYMSPEQVRGGEITPATDVYALGAILYEMLTGRTPFIGLSIAEIYARIQSEDAPRPGSIHDGVPSDLEAVALKAIAKEPAHRYESARAFADDLGRHLRGEPVLARPEGVLSRARRRLSRHRAILIPSALAALLVVIFGAVALLSARAKSRRADALVSDAAAAEKRGDLRGAERAYFSALEVRPGDDDAAQGAERCRLRLRRAEVLVRDAEPLVAEAILNLYRDDVPVASLRAKAAEARDHLARAVAEAPMLVEAHLQLGRVLELLGDRRGAEAALRRAEELEPASQAVQAALGRLLVESAYLSTLMSTATGTPELADEKRRALADEKRRALAAEATRRLERASIGRLGTVEEWIERAFLAFARERFDEAAWIAREGITACVGRQGVETLHWILGVTTRTEASIAALSNAIELKPRYALALEVRASVLMLMNKLAAAEGDFTRALELMPDSEASYVNRGTCRFRLERLAEAEADFNEALRIAPDHAGTYLNRAMTRLALNRGPEALADFAHAIVLHPHYAVAYGQRARAHYKLGDSTAALADANQALAMDPDLSMACTVRGSVLFEREDVQGALRDLNRALDLDPANLVARRVRARVRGRLQDWAGARADLDLALADGPDAEMYFLRAGTRLALRDFAGVEVDCTEGLKLKPGTGDALALRAAAREQLKNTDGALEDARAALRAGVSTARAEALRQMIERLERRP